MNKTIQPFRLPKEPLTLKQMVGQLFMPAAFINDTEAEVQKMEQLIREQHVGFHLFLS